MFCFVSPLSHISQVNLPMVPSTFCFNTPGNEEILPFLTIYESANASERIYFLVAMSEKFIIATPALFVYSH